MWDTILSGFVMHDTSIRMNRDLPWTLFRIIILNFDCTIILLAACVFNLNYYGDTIITSICHYLARRLYFYIVAFLKLIACFASLSSTYYSGILCNLTIFASHPDVSRHAQERMNNSRERVQEGGGRTLRKRKIEGSRSKAWGTEAEEGPATSDPPGNHERPEARERGPGFRSGPTRPKYLHAGCIAAGATTGGPDRPRPIAN